MGMKNEIKLAYDMCRCFGRNQEDNWTCPERTDCKRFLVTLGGSNGERVPYTMCLNDFPEKPCTARIPKES